MKRKTVRKLDYLKEALISDISLIEENENVVNSFSRWRIQSYNGHEITGIIKILAYILISLILLLVFIVEFPFLLFINLLIIFDGIKNGVPIKLIPILLPEKRIDLIDNKIKIEIRHNEHPPPHFHIIIDNEDFSMEILTGKYLHHEIKNGKHKRAVAKWYNNNRKLLIKAWNESRPTYCQVGKI